MREYVRKRIRDIPTARVGILEKIDGDTARCIVNGQVYPVRFVAGLGLTERVGEEVVITFIDKDLSDGIVTGIVTDEDTSAGGVSTEEFGILAGRVGANEGLISDNSTEIGLLGGRVEVNEGLIGTNTSDIIGLDGRVGLAEGLISDNADNIGLLDGRVGVNESGLASLGARVGTAESNITSLGNTKADKSALTEHTSATNPHGITKATVGLGNVDNTSDASKPISTATQTALNAKQDKLIFEDKVITDSDNPVTSGGIWRALDDLGTEIYMTMIPYINEFTDNISALSTGKQDKLTFDDEPVEGSDNPVKGGGIYNALNTGLATKVGLTGDESIAGLKNFTGTYTEGRRFIAWGSNTSAHGIVSRGSRANMLYDNVGITGGIASALIDVDITNGDDKKARVGKVGIYGNATSGDDGYPKLNYMWFSAITDNTYNKDATLKVDSQDRVGIAIAGTGRPSQALDVNGKIRMRSQTASGDGADIVTTKGYVDSGLGSKADASALTSHINADNPHGITKSTVGLGKVDNTSDLAKPISTATQTALNLKADTSALTSGLAEKLDLSGGTMTGMFKGKEGRVSIDEYGIKSTRPLTLFTALGMGNDIRFYDIFDSRDYIHRIYPFLSSEKGYSLTTELDNERSLTIYKDKVTVGTEEHEVYHEGNLTADKITYGTFAVDRIPSLSANKITSGTFDTDRIPSLATSKITGLDTKLNGIDTSITSLNTAVGGKVTANSAVTGATKCKITYDSKGLVTAGADLTDSDIPNLNASKINAGTLADARIPTTIARSADVTAHTGNTSNPHNVTKAHVGLDKVDNVKQYSATNQPPYPVTSVAGKTGAVTLAESDIPALPASKITSGAFSSARIPSLPASKITSGTLGVDRIPQIGMGKVDGLSGALVDNYDSMVSYVHSNFLENHIPRVRLPFTETQNTELNHEVLNALYKTSNKFGFRILYNRNMNGVNYSRIYTYGYGTDGVTRSAQMALNVNRNTGVGWVTAPSRPNPSSSDVVTHGSMLNMMTQTVQFVMEENDQLRQELNAMKNQLMGQTGAMK